MANRRHLVLFQDLHTCWLPDQPVGAADAPSAVPLSTFDLGDAGLVVFGPAKRALPQLPIAVDAEGYIVAQRDFLVPPGPSFFERDSRNDFKRGDN